MPFIVFMVISGGAWIGVLFTVLKKKTNIFPDQMEPKVAERCLKMLKAFLLVAGISLVAYIGLTVNILLFRPPDYEEAVAFFIGFFSIILFFIGLIGSLVMLLKGRRKRT